MRWMIMAAMAMLAGTVVAVDGKSLVALKDHLGHTWADELVSYPLEGSLAGAKAVRVIDEAGVALPSQVHEGRVYTILTLPADGQRTLSFVVGEAAAPAVSARIADANGLFTLESGSMALRLPAGEKVYAPPVDGTTVPGPLQGVRGAAGAWIGKSWLETPLKVTGYKTTVTATGPVFVEARIDYTFEGGKRYQFTARAIAGQPAAVISESMDLNPGGQYRLLSYDNDKDDSSWEWWNLADAEHLLPGEGNKEQPANAVFSFYENLEPNQCRWIAGRPTHPRKGVDAAGKPTIMQETGELYAPLTYEYDERFNRLTGWWLNSFSDRSYAFSLINDAKPDRPVVSLIMGRPSRNVNPHMDSPREPWVRILTGLNDMRIHTRKDKDLRVLAPICLGSREWLLMVEPQSALRPKGDPEIPNTQKMLIKHSYYPLEKIKDWSFDWPEPANAWPRLFCKAGDMAAMKARVAAATGDMAKSHLIPIIYKTNGTVEAMANQILQLVTNNVNGALTGTRHGGMNWFHASLHMMQTMPVWEAAMATPGIDPATRAKIKAYGAFIAQRAWDEDYWPPKNTANGWGSANMGILAAGARVLSAGAMAGHPKQAAWLKRSRGYLEGNLMGAIADDGSGVSCPHYLGASIDPIMYMALALKYGGNYNVFKEDPRWPKFCQFMIDILTPPDVRSPVSGPHYALPMVKPPAPGERLRRNLWPLAHTSRTEPSGILGMLALGMEGVDEKVAGALRFMCDEMGQSSSGAFVAYALLQNTSSKIRDPDLRTRWYPSYGAMLRDRQPEETWMATRYSKFAFDHFQSDMGAFTLFAKGVPLMMDFGSMYSPENGQPVYHNRVAWNVKEGAARPCPGNQKEGCFYRGLTYFEHTNEPWTCQTEGFGEGQSPTDSFGEITEFASLEGADYFLGETKVTNLQTLPHFPDTSAALAPDPNQKRKLESVPEFTWQRRVLFVKAAEPKDPQFVLVRDDFTAPCPPPTVSYWVMASNVTVAGAAARASGQFGVDLDLRVLLPAKPAVSTWGWSHKNWGGETQVCVRVTQAEGKPFLALLYPRRPDEPAPLVTPLASGNAVRVEAGGYVFWAALGAAPVSFTDGDVSFEGVVGVVRKSPDGIVDATLAAKGEVRYGKQSLKSGKPAAKRLRR